MKVVRSKVFETNSSSTHSICICQDAALNDTIPHKGTITLEGGEFSWEIRTYTDAETKANYLAQYANETYKLEEWGRMVKEVVEEQTGAKVILKPTGYIDHQSVGNFDDVFTDKEHIRSFIFSKDSILKTDNDNH